MFLFLVEPGSLPPYLGIWTFSTGSESASILSFSDCLLCCFSNYFFLNSSNLFNFSPFKVSESIPISSATAYYLSSISLSSLFFATKSYISSILCFCSSWSNRPPKLSPPHCALLFSCRLCLFGDKGGDFFFYSKADRFYAIYSASSKSGSPLPNSLSNDSLFS